MPVPLNRRSPRAWVPTRNMMQEPQVLPLHFFPRRLLSIVQTVVWEALQCRASQCRVCT